MKEVYIGKTFKCQNGKDYTILVQRGDRALLIGGQDFVVIDDLSYFVKTGSWGNGTYFPHFYEEERSYTSLDKALYYFENRDYKDI